MADFSKITERLFCGAQINNAVDMLQIVGAGVTHIIDAQVERNDGGLLEASTMYLWDPTADDGQHPKPVPWFKVAVEFATNAFADPGMIVMTHCAAGVNRGPSLAYAIMRAQGWSAIDAEAQLRKGRPQVNIAYKADAEQALRMLGWTK
jgi:dual specificity phosphatase 3